MSDPVEKAFVQLCRKYDISFTRPECDQSIPSTLDFHLTDYGLSVETKQFSSDRIHEQIMRSGEKNVMVLIGIGSVSALDRLLEDMESSG